MPTGDSPDWKDSGLPARLDAFAQGREDGAPVLPWAAQLSPRDRERLRSELALVLSEPRLTGEPVDWGEVDNILREWAELAGWDGALVSPVAMLPEGPYSIELRSSDTETLAKASSAVQQAVYTLLTEFLPHYPTAGDRLPRGRLKKLKNRDVWQIELPDGYRMRYLADQSARTVHIIYLGPHPERDMSGREQAARSRMKQGRNGNTG
jgi:hypothetical protein